MSLSWAAGCLDSPTIQCADGTVCASPNVCAPAGGCDACAAPRDTFPAAVSFCLTGLAIVDAETVQVTDSCTGMLIELWRQPGQ